LSYSAMLLAPLAKVKWGALQTRSVAALSPHAGSMQVKA